MVIAENLSNVTDGLHLPTAMKPAYALASELGNATDTSFFPTGYTVGDRR
jgi:hypothetical protein